MIDGKILVTTACVAFFSATLLGQEPPRYRVVNLGTLGGSYGEAVGLSDQGSIGGVGTLAGDETQHGIVWVPRGKRIRKIDIGTLGGPNSLTFARPTAKGEVVGRAERSDLDPQGEDFCGFGTQLTCLPFLWSGSMTPLPTLGGNNGFATSINNRGQAVGMAETITRDPTCKGGTQVLQFEPAIWENGRVRALRMAHGDSSGLAVAINDSGQIIGSSGGCGTGRPGTTAHALLWQNSAWAPVDLGTLGGTTGNRPQNINSRGQVVGFANLPGDEIFHAWLWQHGKMIDLGTLPGDTYSIAEGINDRGQVVGFSCDADFNCRAFFWQHGTMTDLNTLLPPGSPLFLAFADDINDRGEIVGNAFDPDTGDIPAFLAVPTRDEGDARAASSAARFDLGARVTLAEEARDLVQQRLRRR
jgi:probable HAF family extracellular repeat protein